MMLLRRVRVATAIPARRAAVAQLFRFCSSAAPPEPSVSASAAAAVAASVSASVAEQAAGGSSASAKLDPSTIDPQRLMLVTTRYLADKRKSRPAAQRLLETIEARLDDLPVVFLAEALAGVWPAGMITDSFRVAVRRRIAKGVLDLNGNDVARVFVAWAKPAEQSRDVALFKRLGKLVAFHINDIREPMLVGDLLATITRSGLKPPPGFVALLARRAVALDRRSHFTVPQAISLMTLLDKHDALDAPTATALMNRIVTSVRAEVERIVAQRAALPSGEDPQQNKVVTETVGREEVASAAGVTADVVEAVERDEIKAAAAMADGAPAAPAAFEDRDSRWPLAGGPMEDHVLTLAEAEGAQKRLQLSQRRVFGLLSVMQEHKLTSLLYSRPLVALVLPGVKKMHPLDALRFVRDGGIRRIVSQRLTSAIVEKLKFVDLDFATRAMVLASLVQYRRHLARSVAKENRSPIVLDDPEDMQLVSRVAKEVLAELQNISKRGIQVKPLVSSLDSLEALIASGMAELHAPLVELLPTVVSKFKHLVVDVGTVTIGQCDGMLDVLSKLQYVDAAGDLAVIKAARQQAENDGRTNFECKLQVSKTVFKEIARMNKRLAAGEKLEQNEFDDFFRMSLSRHPMSVLEAVYSYEHAFPKSLSPSLKREIGKALVIRLQPANSSVRKPRPVPLTVEEWPRFVELLRTTGPESVVTAPSVWKFVLEQNASLGGVPEIGKYAEEMLTIFDRRR